MNPRQHDDRTPIPNQVRVPADTGQSIEWYAEGEERTVNAGGVQIAVRFVGRKGAPWTHCDYGTAWSDIPNPRPEQDRLIVRAYRLMVGF